LNVEIIALAAGAATAVTWRLGRSSPRAVTAASVIALPFALEPTDLVAADAATCRVDVVRGRRWTSVDAQTGETRVVVDLLEAAPTAFVLAGPWAPDVACFAEGRSVTLRDARFGHQLLAASSAPGGAVRRLACAARRVAVVVEEGSTSHDVRVVALGTDDDEPNTAGEDGAAATLVGAGTLAGLLWQQPAPAKAPLTPKRRRRRDPGVVVTRCVELAESMEHGPVVVERLARAMPGDAKKKTTEANRKTRRSSSSSSSSGRLADDDASLLQTLAGRASPRCSATDDDGEDDDPARVVAEAILRANGGHDAAVVAAPEVCRLALVVAQDLVEDGRLRLDEAVAVLDALTAEGLDGVLRRAAGAPGRPRVGGTLPKETTTAGDDDVVAALALARGFADRHARAAADAGLVLAPAVADFRRTLEHRPAEAAGSTTMAAKRRRRNTARAASAGAAFGGGAAATSLPLVASPAAEYVVEDFQLT